MANNNNWRARKDIDNIKNNNFLFTEIFEVLGLFVCVVYVAIEERDR